MTSINPSITATRPRSSVIQRETLQSGVVGAAAGTLAGISAGRFLRGSGATVMPFAVAGLLMGAAAGAGTGFARGHVDALSGPGRRTALAETGAGLVAGTAVGAGAFLAAINLPFTRQAANVGAGMGAFHVAFVGAVAIGAAVIVPPILDQLGVLD